MKICLNVVWYSFTIMVAVLMSEGAYQFGGLLAQVFTILLAFVLGTAVGHYHDYREHILEKKWAKKNYP